MGKNFVISDAVVGEKTKRIRIVLEVLHRSSEQVTSVGFMICIVDAYKAYKYEFVQAFSDPKRVDSFTAFIGKLGHQLIFNEFLEDG
ncbi:hypothetical protein EMCRGX_G032475 [Ephydatia muelleri]